MRVPFDARLGIHPQDAAFLDKELWDLENTPADPARPPDAAPPPDLIRVVPASARHRVR